MKLPGSVIAILCLAACNNSEMSRADLEKADWKCIDSGICFISKTEEANSAVKYDSLQLSPIAFTDSISSGVFNLFFSNHLDSLLRSSAPDSKTGYLRINFHEMMPALQITITFDTRYDSTQFLGDEPILKRIPGVQQVIYTSPADALKESGLDPNSLEVKMLLENNPLPAYVLLKMSKTDTTDQQLEDISNYIKKELPFATDVSYPRNPFNKFNRNFNYYVRYSRS